MKNLVYSSRNSIKSGLVLLTVLTVVVSGMVALHARAAPVPPPDGYPKFLNSSMSVTPELATEGGETLAYVIEIRNTGGAAGVDTTMSNPLPANTSYNMDATATSGILDESQVGVLSWSGEVGFDSSVFHHLHCGRGSGVFRCH